jgi:hypothetical protein
MPRYYSCLAYICNGSIALLIASGEDFMEAARHSAEDAAWPLRPWIWAAICAASAFAVNQLDEIGDGFDVWQQVLITFIIIATLAFVLTAELRRLLWAVAFALGSGAVLAFVGWFTASYNKSGEIAEYPFLAGLFALVIAAPIFQTIRDEGGWRFPYARLHSHVWTDAVIGAASLAFTGIAFLLAMLIGQLFELIGIKFFSELLRADWFSMVLAGFAFGAALGLLRERDALLATLQKLVLVIFSVLSPVLAFALIGFLASLPFTGLAPLWDSGVPTTPVLLLAAAGAVGLINAVIGDGKNDGSKNRVLRWSALLLSLTILPLAVIAAISMGARIQQYGFTPDRIWGLLAIIVGCVYGLAYLVAAARSGQAKALLDWDDHIRPANIKIALGVCALALFLALPIFDFGSISAKDQLARLKSGITKAEKFDWQAMAFDFGPKGREALKRLEASGTSDQRKSAKAALSSDDRWNVEMQVQAENADAYARNFTFQPANRVLDEQAKRDLVRDGQCRSPCHVIWMDNNRLMVVGKQHEAGSVESTLYVWSVSSDPSENKRSIWTRDYSGAGGPGGNVNEPVETLQAASKVEIRDVQMQQAFVDGMPVGQKFEK